MKKERQILLIQKIKKINNFSAIIIPLLYILFIFTLSGSSISIQVYFFPFQDKVYHLIEYCLLAFFLLNFGFVKLGINKQNIKKNFKYTTIFIVLFAILDEIHQGFVGYFDSGIFGGVRQVDIFDFLADILGMLLAFFITHKFLITKNYLYKIYKKD